MLPKCAHDFRRATPRSRAIKTPSSSISDRACILALVAAALQRRATKIFSKVGSP